MFSSINAKHIILGSAWIMAFTSLFMAHSPAAAAPAYIQHAQSSMKVCQNFDIVYLLDLSGSMSWSYRGSGSRLDAAKDAIISMNDILIQEMQNNGGESGVRASLVTWRGNSVKVTEGFTDNFSGISATVRGLSASGTTPTALAFREVRGYLAKNADPERQQIILLITDGIPTMDLDGYYHGDYYVNEVPIIRNPNAPSDNYTFRPSNQVRYDGRYNSRINRHVGYPLADAMEEIDGTVSALDRLTVHSIAILGTDFRQDLLYYAASKGGGEYFGASTANQLAGSIQQAVYEGECQSSLKIDVDHTDTFMLGGEPKTVDPNLTVTGQNEDVKSATIEVLANHDQQNDRLFFGDSPADSGIIDGLTWWVDSRTGNLEIVGIGTPETYQTVLRQVKYTNLADKQSDTNMGRRKIRFTIDSAIPNVAPTDNLYDDAFMKLAQLSGTDYGDAPYSYGAASQDADLFFRLGNTVDVEGSAPYSNDAQGDDFSQVDDEDGVVFEKRVLPRGVVNNANVTYLNKNINGATLQAWIDFDQNGVFDVYDDITGSGLILPTGSNDQTHSLSFVVPGDAVCGNTIARFRLTASPVGAASIETHIKGEVEDHSIKISCEPPVIPEPTFDYGDGPDSYGAAQHTIVSGMYLGASVDGESSPMHTFDATGDDTTGIDDEDGIAFPMGQTGIRGQSVMFNVSATNSSYLQSYVNGWADWNQNGTFEAGEQILTNEIVPMSPSVKQFSSWLTVPLDAACFETTIRFRLSGSPVNGSAPVLGGEAEDYSFYVNCDADLAIEIYPDPMPVQLEENINIEAVALNYGPNFAKAVTATVTIPPAIDIESITPMNGWSCFLQPSQLLVDCTKPQLDNGANETMFELTARIPGIYPADFLTGRGEIASTFPDPDMSNNETTYTVDVKKVWTNDGVPVNEMTYFTHAVFDEGLEMSGDNENDFMIDELIQSPYQVPLRLLPGLHLDVPPLLIAEYCLTHDTPGCDSSDAIITGTLKLDQYTLNSLVMQVVDESTQIPQDPADPVNLLASEITINYGLSGDGRYLDVDPDRCMEWATGYEIGNCQAFYDIFKTYPDSTQYEWAPTEYVELIVQSAGGRAVECSSAIGHCIHIEGAKPGVYRLSGVISGQMIFNDPTHERIGSDAHITYFDYSFNIFVRIVSSFTEADQ